MTLSTLHHNLLLNYSLQIFFYIYNTLNSKQSSLMHEIDAGPDNFTLVQLHRALSKVHSYYVNGITLKNAKTHVLLHYSVKCFSFTQWFIIFGYSLI